MTCAEFQKVLPYIIETGGNPEEEEHLRSCPVCSDLVADLKYIAEVAKLLVPMEEPAPRVWEGIQKTLQQEGLVRPIGARGRLLGSPRFASMPWLAGAFALLLVVAGLFLYREAGARPHETPDAVSTTAAQTSPDPDDQQVLAEVSARDPESKPAYEENLKHVNAYIADAKRSVDQDPTDEDARQSLIQAYQQKALLYEMASRSLQ